MNIDQAKQFIIETVEHNWNDDRGEFFIKTEDGLSVDDWNNGDNFNEDLSYRLKDTPATDLIKLVDEYGGEGMGDTYYYVYQLNTPDGEFFIKFSGCYDSWNGTEWYSEPEMVKPVEKVVVEYISV